MKAAPASPHGDGHREHLGYNLGFRVGVLYQQMVFNDRVEYSEEGTSGILCGRYV